MRNLFLTAASSLAVALVLLGNSLAQQAPASAHKPSTTARTSTTRTTTTAKPHTTAGGTEPLKLTTEKDKLSYAIGMSVAGSMKKESVDVDPNIVARGLKDAMTGSKTLLTDEEENAVLQAFRTEMLAKKEAETKQMGETNKQAGEQFLAANKAKEGVVTLASGLQYKVLKEGSGPKPTPADTVVCQYRGTLIDGTEFDSSYKRGQPATFPVTRVIKGWTEALQLMPVGSKWQLFVPADLAYGERSPSPQIGPNSTLIFEVDLVSIQDKDPNKGPNKNP